MIETIYRCDACNKEIDHMRIEAKTYYTLPKINIDGRLSVCGNEILCNDCADKIATFVRSLKKTANKQ